MDVACILRDINHLLNIDKMHILITLRTWNFFARNQWNSTNIFCKVSPSGGSIGNWSALCWRGATRRQSRQNATNRSNPPPFSLFSSHNFQLKKDAKKFRQMHLNFGDIIVFWCVEYHALSANFVTTPSAPQFGGEIPNAIRLVEPCWSQVDRFLRLRKALVTFFW